MKRLLAAAIPLVLLLSVTGSVIAENAPKRLTNNLNLPPEAIDFDLSDLIDADQKQRDQKQRDEWTAYQDKMATAYADTQAFVDSGSDPAAGIEAWQRFLKAFDADNPFGNEDDSMRTRAKDAMLGLEEVERTLQAEWSDYQDKMTKAYQEVLEFLGATQDSELKVQSVNRFLETFSADNPFSEEDNQLRSEINRKLATLAEIADSPKKTERSAHKTKISREATQSASTKATPDEIYGSLPGFSGFSISPEGHHYAFIKREGAEEKFVIVDSKSHEVSGFIDASKFKARGTYFATEKHVLLLGSTKHRYGEFENSGALVYNLDTRETRLLLEGTKRLHEGQSGLGRVVGVNRAKQQVYMPAFAAQPSRSPPYHLYRVSLKSGIGRIHARGKNSTLDWFVSSDGSVLAREDYSKKKQEHRVYSKVTGKWELIYALKTDVPEISISAISADSSKLLFVKLNGRDGIYSMRLADGYIEGPSFTRDDADVEELVLDIDRKLVAIQYSGFLPDYQFTDVEDDALYGRISATFPMSSVYFQSATHDRKSIIVKVSGIQAAGDYFLFDKEKISLSKLASEYPDVRAIGELKAIKYIARDGLKIPAVLTFPVEIEKRENLPLIVMPHGGPEWYDSIRFDWFAQLFANQGYLVLQPNFRGSSGFGDSFMQSGRGKWGREMQDDVTDGVLSLIEMGYVDPSRVCIVGASYGGYSALAGGAFSPEMYRCIVAINAISDLPAMLSDKKRQYGGHSLVVSYWEKLLGDSKLERGLLDAISPVNHAEKFDAPVLLIHGKDDTVVPISQSRGIEKALKKAGKDVQFIELAGEDHWLSTSATRLAMVQEILEFVDTHNPSD